ncbi:PLP-dependent aminotransferase family protein [Paenibacillus psychroresistens]|uniref:PLP-dependent aminotransferase family protein n=1 Tax=Paenibacillus psychroresistens TaxID=1778678 RepID=A0A6B8RKE8_9BACL|nr:PLP-dependent aminotransferase family protein [Paenibacillus psychroresistens]QGQ96065.1 PLP-dependent aminotransferase family protein [Paenibacillus psychroresistens]
MNKYIELMNEIEMQIASGSIRGGQRLPSIRELSARHQCSSSTVIRAYAELEKRHLVYTIPQSGYYAVLKKAESRQQSVGTEAVLDFSSASPDPELFPYLDFQHCLNKAIDIYRNRLFVYGTPQGLPSLLPVLSRHLADTQVFAKPEEIVITSGVQQALAILTAMPFPTNRSTVLVEQPTYHMMIRLLETMNIQASGITRTENGIDLDELEKLFRVGDIKLFYTIPRFHNPLGTSYDENTKKAIASLARKYDVYIVEDDYLVDLETGTKSDPIHAYSSSHVIYLKSYSKILFPGLRIGVAVLPQELMDMFCRYKNLSDIDSSMVSQAALEIYIQNGLFSRRKHKIANTYHNRLLRLNAALDQYNNSAYVWHARVSSGVHTHLRLRESAAIPDLLNRLSKQKIILKTSNDGFLTGFTKQPIIKLSVTRTEEALIEEGIQTIFAEIRKTRF